MGLYQDSLREKRGPYFDAHDPLWRWSMTAKEMAAQRVGESFDEEAGMPNPGAMAGDCRQAAAGRADAAEQGMKGCGFEAEDSQGRLPPIDSRPPAMIMAMPSMACRSGVWFHSTWPAISAQTMLL